MTEWKIQYPVPRYRDCSTFAERKKERIKMSEERWHEVAYVRKLEARVAELEAMEIRRHELHALREMINYTRCFAQQFPDAPGDTFAAKQKVYAGIVEEL